MFVDCERRSHNCRKQRCLSSHVPYYDRWYYYFMGGARGWSGTRRLMTSSFEMRVSGAASVVESAEKDERHQRRERQTVTIQQQKMEMGEQARRRGMREGGTLR